jgi:hypothetical protein
VPYICTFEESMGKKGKKKKRSSVNSRPGKKKSPIQLEQFKTRQKEAATKIQALQRGRVARVDFEERRASIEKEGPVETTKEKSVEVPKEGPVETPNREGGVTERPKVDENDTGLEGSETEEGERVDAPADAGNKKEQLVIPQVQIEKIKAVGSKPVHEMTATELQELLEKEEKEAASRGVKLYYDDEEELEKIKKDHDSKSAAATKIQSIQRKKVAKERVLKIREEKEAKGTSPPPPPPVSPSSSFRPMSRSKRKKRPPPPKKNEAHFLAKELKEEIKSSSMELDKAKEMLVNTQKERLRKEEAFRIVSEKSGYEEELGIARNDLRKVQDELAEERDMRARLSQNIEDLMEKLKESEQRKQKAELVVIQVDEAVKAKDAEIRELQRKLEQGKRLVKSAREDAKFLAQLEIERLKTELECRTQLLNMRWQRHEQMMRESYETHSRHMAANNQFVKPGQFFATSTSLPQLHGVPSATKKNISPPPVVNSGKSSEPSYGHHSGPYSSGVSHMQYPPGMAPPGSSTKDFSLQQHSDILSQLGSPPSGTTDLPAVHPGQSSLAQSPSAESAVSFAKLPTRTTKKSPSAFSTHSAATNSHGTTRRNRQSASSYSSIHGNKRRGGGEGSRRR